MRKFVWSRPHHGVQHTDPKHSLGFWATATDYGTCAELFLWFPGHGFRVEPILCETAEKARYKAEVWLNERLINGVL